MIWYDIIKESVSLKTIKECKLVLRKEKLMAGKIPKDSNFAIKGTTLVKYKGEGLTTVIIPKGITKISKEALTVPWFLRLLRVFLLLYWRSCFCLN